MAEWRKNKMSYAALGLALGAAMTSAALAQNRGPSGNSDSPMLERLEKGRWTLTERGAKAPMRSVCIGNLSEIIRPEHRGQNCTQHRLEESGNRVSFHYKCEGSGHGHTNILRETNRLVQIETQGFVNRRPFDRQIEARRVGNC